MHILDNTKITIEYNQCYTDVKEENDTYREGTDWQYALPQVHTCVNIMKIPPTAYNGNMELFDEKVAKAMELTSAFDME